MFIHASRTVSMALGAAVLASSVLMTGTAAAKTPDRDDSNALHSISFPTDPRFTQLLGINDHGIIAGYHGDEGTENTPNKGFTLRVADNQNNFTDENFPGSMQTQVIGINNAEDTVGFYVDNNNVQHGFVKLKGNDAESVNNSDDVVGSYVDANGVTRGFVYDNGKYESIEMQGAQSTVINGINNRDELVGFFMDANGNTIGLLGHRKS